jgi:hypothetical protein
VQLPLGRHSPNGFSDAATSLSGILILAMNYGSLAWGRDSFSPGALPLAPLTVALCSRELMKLGLCHERVHTRDAITLSSRAAAWVTALIDGCGFLKTVGVFRESVRFCRFISVEEVRFRLVCV